MKSKEALEIIKNEVEYLTRLDYVEPVVRGEVRELLYNAYHKTTPEFDIIERDLDILDLLKKLLMDVMLFRIVDIQDYKYLAIPNADPRKPDALLPISEQEYNLLKECLSKLNKEN